MLPLGDPRDSCTCHTHARSQRHRVRTAPPCSLFDRFESALGGASARGILTFSPLTSSHRERALHVRPGYRWPLAHALLFSPAACWLRTSGANDLRRACTVEGASRADATLLHAADAMRRTRDSNSQSQFGRIYFTLSRGEARSLSSRLSSAAIDCEHQRRGLHLSLLRRKPRRLAAQYPLRPVGPARQPR